MEDDKPIRLLTEQILESNGYIVFDFEAAEAALEEIQTTEDLDLVITDFILPDMNGAELVTTLESRFGDLKAIYMSGYVGRALNLF